MSADSDHLDPLVSLLKAKKAPQPSSQFFNQMSTRIQESIQNPPPASPVTWWQRLAHDMDLKACLVGILVCGLMLCGILFAMRWDTTRHDPTSPYTTLPHKGQIAPSAMVLLPSPHPFTASARTNSVASSAAPVMLQSQSNSLFEIPIPSSATPVNYWTDHP